MNTILMTGISGIVGNVLASTFIQDENVEIVAIIRVEEDEEEIRSSLRVGIKGLGYMFSESLFNRLHFIATKDWQQEHVLESVFEKYSPNEVWHVASRMRYDLGEFVNTMQFNVIDTAKLCDIATKYCERFFYLSTIGIAGSGSQKALVVPEGLMKAFEVLNPYTVSKCFAEHIVYHMCQQTKMKMIILRLSSVIGHSQSGWIKDTKFGYYSYLHMLRKFKNKKGTYYFDLNPECRVPTIPIDYLAKVCELLRVESGMKQCQIFNLMSKSLLPIRRHFEIFQKVTGASLCIGYGKGEKGSNIMFNQINAHNNLFMSTQNTFITEELEGLIGRDNMPADIDEKTIENVIRGYIDERI